ncbi:hypothetical protein DM01DRAFT_253072 [Hesseltinella vesiculosa]|uniref:BZIP domain-containing protein n=1 Tax=Hesseltinella vesiculosa TaxID=101127 RepID=A0A1X2GVJ9_9FUNG|nr:hypothetical protein DM01DRAFT_253072 [Hesseltinella vesiculosa]
MPPVVNPMDMTKKPTPLHTTPIAALPAPVSDHTISSKKRPSPVDTNDAMTLKRQKNTDAARRSRMRKALKMEALEKRVAELEDANKLLLNKVTDAEIERNSCQDKVDGHRHTIEALEKELATAHKALLDESQASPEASATT